jgi:hypothetical protein
MHSPLCRRCAREFEATRSDARYCSPACRGADWRARDARVRDLLMLHAAVVREGMALLSMEAVRPELDRIADELDALTEAS